MELAVAESFRKKLLTAEEEELRKTIDEGNISTVIEVEEKLFESELKYREKKGRKWISLIVGAIIGGGVGFILMPYIY